MTRILSAQNYEFFKNPNKKKRHILLLMLILPHSVSAQTLSLASTDDVKSAGIEERKRQIKPPFFCFPISFAISIRSVP